MSRITPRFLAYILRRMAISFTVIRILEEGPGERGFHEVSLCLHINNQLHRTESPPGVAKTVRGVCETQTGRSKAMQAKPCEAAQQFRDGKALFSFLVYYLPWRVALSPFTYFFMVQDGCCDPALAPAFQIENYMEAHEVKGFILAKIFLFIWHGYLPSNLAYIIGLN